MRLNQFKIDLTWEVLQRQLGVPLEFVFPPLLHGRVVSDTQLCSQTTFLNDPCIRD